MGRPKGSKNKATLRLEKKERKSKVIEQVIEVKKEKKVKEPKKLKLTVSRIICVKCDEKKTTTKAAMDKLISLFGSIEEVHQKYHCSKCRKLHNVRKDGKPKPEKNKRRPKIKFEKTEDGAVIIPTWMVGTAERNIRPCSDEDLFKGGPVCHNSEMFLKQNRACNGCKYIPLCNCTLKNVVEVTETKKPKKTKKVKND